MDPCAVRRQVSEVFVVVQLEIELTLGVKKESFLPFAQNDSRTRIRHFEVRDPELTEPPSGSPMS